MPTINSWNNTVSAANVSFTGGTFQAGTDVATNAISIGTAGARTVTVGSTTTTAATNLKCGTGNFSLASASGNLMVANNMGPINFPLQPAFLAQPSGVLSNVTGDGTVYTLVCATEIFDQHSDFDGTSTFTAPVTGKYLIGVTLSMTGMTSSHTNSVLTIVTTGGSYYASQCNVYAVHGASGVFTITGSALVNMTATNTCTVTYAVYNGTKVISLTTDSKFYGTLLC